jgi:hypothetical protein
MLPSLVSRILVPEVKPAAPAGFTRVDDPMQRGLPHAVNLTADRRLLIVVPAGMATFWRDAAAGLPVSTAAGDYGARDLGADPPRDYVAQAPVTALFQVANQTVAAAPFKAGARLILPSSGQAPAAIELVLLDWAIYAGTLRGAGDFGSFVSLAWRNADAGVDQFSAPPLNPVFVARQPPALRLQSETGGQRPVLNARFQFKRSLLA